MLPTTSTLIALIDKAVCADNAMLTKLQAVFGERPAKRSGAGATSSWRLRLQLSTCGLSPDCGNSFIITLGDNIDLDRSDDTTLDDAEICNESGLQLHIWLSKESNHSTNELAQAVNFLRDLEFSPVELWRTLDEAFNANRELLKMIDDIERYRSKLVSGVASASFLAVEEVLAERGLLPGSERALTIVNDLPGSQHPEDQHGMPQLRLHVCVKKPMQLACVAAQTWNPCGTVRAPWEPAAEA